MHQDSAYLAAHNALAIVYNDSSNWINLPQSVVGSDRHLPRRLSNRLGQMTLHLKIQIYYFLKLS